MLESFARARVLVIDDNLAHISLLEALLVKHGLESVHSVTDAEQALTAVEELRPDLVLLDLHMPAVAGRTVLGALRRRFGPLELPVAVLTADVTRQATHQALSLGANDVLTKPLDVAEVVLRVRNLLEVQSLHQ